jgi:GNAT superfamily N-acetyltransferase
MFVTDTMRDCEVARKAQVPVVRIEPGHKIEPGLFDNADVIPLPKNRFDEAVKLYRRVWRDTDVYAEVFSKDEAEREIRDFSDAWIVQDSGRCIIGLVGGMPLAKYIESLKTGAYDEHRRRTVHDMFGRTIGACYYIDTLAVRPDCQGEGLGSRLLDFFIHEMLKGGVSCFVLRTTLHPDNPAIKLYRKFGFEPLVDRESRMPVTQMVEQKRLPHHPKWDCRIWLQGNSHSLNLPPRTPL